VPRTFRRRERRPARSSGRPEQGPRPDREASLPTCASPGAPSQRPRQAAAGDRAPLPTDPRTLPELPASYETTLEECLRALDLRLSTGARAAIDAQAQLLLAWSGSINLTALRTPEQIAREHIADSLTALSLLRGQRLDGLLDIGSGAGYPGLPIALTLPVRRVALVESTVKKARFLEVVAQAARALLEEHGEAAVEIEVIAERAEGLAEGGHAGGWPIVTARAVARFDRLVELALPLLAPGGQLVAWKRDDGSGALDRELESAARALERGGLESPPTVELVAVPGLEDHRLVVVRRPSQPSSR
jgi:16S rRNA (guanine527-N7)-methyltransferase